MDRKILWTERSAKLKGARASGQEEVDADPAQPEAEAEAEFIAEEAERGRESVEDGSKIKDVVEAEERAELLRNESLGIRPGAVAVRGPGYPRDEESVGDRAGGEVPQESTRPPPSRRTRSTSSTSPRGRSGFVAESWPTPSRRWWCRWEIPSRGGTGRSG
jgi:hypothetical protein